MIPSQTARAYRAYRAAFDAAVTAPELFVQGYTWYERMQREVERIAHDLYVPKARIAKALSVLSRQTRWELLLRGFPAWVEDPTAPLPAYNGSKQWARKILDGEEVAELAYERQPKLWSFAENLQGETYPVTIDSWMFSVAGVEQAGSSAYGELSALVRQLAHEVRLTPRDTQAVIWVAAREGIL